MPRYMVDAQPLDTEEYSRHKAACNAALSRLAGDSNEQDIEHDFVHNVGCSFDIADEVVREYRRRIARCLPRSEEPVEKASRRFLLASDEKTAAWLADSLSEEDIMRRVIVRYRRTRNALADIGAPPFVLVATKVFMDNWLVTPADFDRLVAEGVLVEVQAEEVQE